MKKYFAAMIVIALFGAVTAATAVGNLGDATKNLRGAGTNAGTTETDIAVVAGSAVNIALGLVGLIFLMLMVYAGYLWMTARGEAEQVQKAQRIITATIIGLVIVMSAYAITALVTTRLGSVG